MARQVTVSTPMLVLAGALAVAVVAIAVLVTLVLAGDDGTTQPPDRVVGIEWRCTFVPNGATGQAQDLRGAVACLAGEKGGAGDVHSYPDAPGARLYNRRQELTIRTADAKTYTVNVAADARSTACPSCEWMALGDEWPPK